MKMKVLFAAALLAAAGAYGAADPQLLGLMMPDAKVITGFQVADSQSTPFGRFLMKQIPANAGLDNFVSATGFDPRQDLHEIVAATSDGDHWLIAGRGSFMSTRTAGLAEMAGATVTRYKGVDLITGKSNDAAPNRPQRGGNAPSAAAPAANAVAFLDTSTALIGDELTVKAAIDRHAAGAVFNGPLALKARDVSARNQAFAATVSSVTDLAPGLNGTQVSNVPLAGLFQAITAMSAGVQFGSNNVTLTAEAAMRSPQDAQSLSDILHFVMSMAQANRKDPDTGNLAALADATSITASGASVKITLSVPEQQLEQLFPSQAGVKKISFPAR